MFSSRWFQSTTVKEKMDHLYPPTSGQTKDWNTTPSPLPKCVPANVTLNNEQSPRAMSQSQFVQTSVTFTWAPLPHPSFFPSAASVTCKWVILIVIVHSQLMITVVKCSGSYCTKQIAVKVATYFCFNYSTDLVASLRIVGDYPQKKTVMPQAPGVGWITRDHDQISEAEPQCVQQRATCDRCATKR